MQQLTRDHLFKNQGNPCLPAEPPLCVDLGETFEIETADTGQRNVSSAADVDKPFGPMGGNPWTGPVYVRGVKAGDVLAITIEDLRVDDHCFLELGEMTLLPPERVKPRRDFIEVRDGVAHFPGGIRAPIRPMLGCFGVVPAPFIADPWNHGGNMDIPQIGIGSTVHIRCQRDGGYFACGDAHARQGEGEINSFSLEVSVTARLRIDRSAHQYLQGLFIETVDRIYTVGIALDLRDSIRQAVGSMSDLLAHAKQMDLLDAYQLASHLGDARLGAIWPLWRPEWNIPLPVCLGLDRSLVRW